MITDLRTSFETASSQRAKALKGQDDVLIHALEAKVSELSQQVAEGEKKLKDMEALEKNQTNQVRVKSDEVQTAMRIQEEFKNSFKRFLGPGKFHLPRFRSNTR